MSAVEREVYIREAAKRIDVTPETLKNDVERVRRKMVREMRKNESSEALKTVHRYGDTVNPDAAKNVKMSSAEEAIIGMLLQYDDHRAAVAGGKIELAPELRDAAADLLGLLLQIEIVVKADFLHSDTSFRRPRTRGRIL